jgi:hypothetical protein
MGPLWTGAAVSVAGFATAIIFGVFKGNAQTAYNTEVSNIETAVGFNSMGACNKPSPSLSSPCANLASDGNDVSTDATVANVGIAIGVVGAGFALGWYLFAPKAEPKPASTAQQTYFRPMVGPHVGGLGMGGSF